MAKSLEAFAGGINVEWTCYAGYRAIVTLIEPKKMSNRSFRNYISRSQNACTSCQFEIYNSCSHLNSYGKAKIDSNGGVAENELKRRNAPCAQGKVIVHR
jgi:hypothetical protein